MADSRSFLLFDSGGAPLTTATPTYVDYRDRSANSRTPPANPVHVGGGLYVFNPTDADEAAGTVALIDGGASASPQRAAFAIHLASNSNQFWAWHVEDVAGALWTGTAPTVGVYRDKSGNARTPPSIAGIAGAYLYALTPTTADVSAEVNVRVDQPANASTGYLYGDSVPLATTVFPAPSAGLSAEQTAATYMVQYLRQYLPPKVTQLNTLRAAVLMTPGVGTGSATGWLISSGMILKLGTVRDGSTTSVTLPTGSNVTAAQIATTINATPVAGITASADAAGRLVLTSNTAPVAPSTGSSVFVGADTTGANIALGWGAGGEHQVMGPINPPGYRGVMSGYPIAPDSGLGFWVVLGDRTARPYPSPGADIRRGETEVSFTLEIFKPEMNQSPHRSREAIETCVRAIREVLQTTDGRQLGRASSGDVTRVDIGQVAIAGRPFSFTDTNSPNVTFDVASMTVTVRIFQRSQS